jgi:site-specific recombinase XerD
MMFTETRDEFLMYLQVERNFPPNTLTSYELDLLTFEGFLKRHNRSQQIEDFNPSTVRLSIQELVLKKKLKPRTVARKISCLKSFSKYCLKERFLEKDFMAGIENPKFDNRLPIYMNLDELKLLFTYLESDSGPLALRNELMFKFLATTGLRRQELVDLCWKHVDFVSMTVKVMGKGKKERLLPLHPMIQPLLKHYKESQLGYRIHSEEPIFLNHHGRKLNPRGLHKIFKEVLAKAGLPPHRFSPLLTASFTSYVRYPIASRE